MEDAIRWDPERYARFRAERSRPFHDLLARVPDGDVRAAADLGCGTGELTRSLLARWPSAELWGVDRSPEMLARAREDAPSPRLTFVEADLATWEPPRPLDRIVSNAALQWLPDHAGLLARLAERLAPGGVLAVQVPNNGREPAYRILADLLAEPRWAELSAAAGPRPAVETPEWYAERLEALGLDVELWVTTYFHALPDAAAVAAWLEGTSLRPILSAARAEQAATLRTELAERLREAYPAGPRGVRFPFRRIFFVARRQAGG